MTIHLHWGHEQVSKGLQWSLLNRFSLAGVLALHRLQGSVQHKRGRQVAVVCARLFTPLILAAATRKEQVKETAYTLS